MKKLFLLIAVSCCFCNCLYAQQAQISGRVTNDATGMAVPGASIQLQGGINSVAKADGTFSIAIARHPALLIITAAGFDTAVISTANMKAPFLEIRLVPKLLTMQDVTVTNGYQLLPRERATGSFENIDNKLLNRAVGTNILNRLEGVSSGLYFNKMMGNREIFIRGLSTLNAATGPLIVLDNFPYEGSIDNIDPDNIESITILRDAAAASIWGAKAANGVIVINTRKGRYAQKRNVWVNTVVTVDAKPNLFNARNFMNPQDFISVERFLFGKGFYNSNLNNRFSYPVISPVVELLAQQRSGLITETEAEAGIAELGKTDIRNQYATYLYQQAITQQYSAGISGGADNSSYLLGFGYDKIGSNTRGNGGWRANINTQLNLKLLPALELQTALTYTVAEDTYNGFTSIVPGGGKNFMYPYARLADDAGNALPVAKDYRSTYSDTAGTGYLLNWKYKPLDELNNSDNTISRTEVLLRMGIKYDFSKTLGIELKGQLEKSNSHSKYYYSTATYYARNIINRFTQRQGDAVQLNVPMGGILDNGYSDLLSAGARAQVNYNGRFGKWYQLSALAGAELRTVHNTGQQVRTYGFDKELLNFANVNYNMLYPLWGNLGYENIERYAGFTNTLNRFVSYFSNAALTIRSKYVASFSIRKDASNLFGVNTNQKWNPFWSAGLSWKINDEAFYGLQALPVLKARITYGYSGNILPGLSGQPVISYGSNTVIPVPYAYAVSPANPNLRWEKTGTLNLGIDFGTANNRINGSIDYYSKKSTDLFSYVPVDPTVGIGQVMLNAAELSSKGFNVKINSLNINRKFKWETQVLLDHVKNRVTKAYNEFTNKGGYAGGGITITPIAGKDPYALISFKWAGLDPQTGDPRGYLNGEISKNYEALYSPSKFEDMSIKGSTRPSVYGSIRNSFSFKGWSLSANISYAFGYYFRRSSINYNSLYRSWAMNIDFAERWQQPGDELRTNVPSMVYPTNAYREIFYTYSDATVEKGDHVRLRDIQLSYSFAGSTAKTAFIKNCELYCYINNVGILWRANKRGIDPDFGQHMPAPVSVSAGFKTNF